MFEHSVCTVCIRFAPVGRVEDFEDAEGGLEASFSWFFWVDPCDAIVDGCLEFSDV